jgi:hypothetical protein
MICPSGVIAGRPCCTRVVTGLPLDVKSAGHRRAGWQESTGVLRTAINAQFPRCAFVGKQLTPLLSW